MLPEILGVHLYVHQAPQGWRQEQCVNTQRHACLSCLIQASNGRSKLLPRLRCEVRLLFAVSQHARTEEPRPRTYVVRKTGSFTPAGFPADNVQMQNKQSILLRQERVDLRGRDSDAILG